MRYRNRPHRHRSAGCEEAPGHALRHRRLREEGEAPLTRIKGAGAAQSFGPNSLIRAVASGYSELPGGDPSYAANSGPGEAEKIVFSARSPSASRMRKFGWLLSRMMNGTGLAWMARSS